MARIIQAFTQFFDDSGAPLVDGWLKFNETGTNNTDKATWADINETKPNTNPVPLDAAGRCPNVFGTGSYSVISFKDSIITPGTPGEQVQQFDPVGGNLEGTAFADWNAATIYSIGDKVTGSDGLDYRSLTNNNQNNNPTSSATNWEQLILGRIWNANVTYSAFDNAYGSDGQLYRSVLGSNLNNDPVSDDGTNWGPGSAADAQIQSVTGTVAASSLTLGQLPSRLDFRSTTLGDGVRSNVEFSALSLVVPSGATLGTVDAIQSHVVLLAINNAGTVELAVVNLAGGVNLDETTLINTTAIDATADSNNVIYSTTARSSVAFRVVGVVESTQATAGTWATAPSLVQGAGGNALTAMQSLGYGQTWQDVTGSRSVTTVFTNTTGRSIAVSIVMLNSAVSWGTTLDVAGVTVVNLGGGGAQITTRVVLQAVIPPGATYSVPTFTSTVLNAWLELR